MLSAGATGVGTYADTLLATLGGAGAEPLVLTATGRPQGRLRRWIGAFSLRPHFARHNPAERRLEAGPELFRQAQVHFNLYGRPLLVKTDAPGGLMHWTYPVPLRIAGWRNVYTVHDAIPLTHPSLTPIDARRHRALLTALAVDADRFVTVSEAARLEIVNALGCRVDLVTSLHQGVAPPTSGGTLPQRLSPGSYFLFCGAIEPRKNLARLIDAHAASGSKRRLVIVGPDGWRAADIVAKIDRSPNVTRLSYQNRQTLDALIRHARALLFPSSAEGFGIPIIEAMMAETAVMTAGRGALREVAGEAALMIDPEDTRAMAAAIGWLDQDDALVAELVAAGARQSVKFSIPAYAGRLAQLHADIFGLNA